MSATAGDTSPSPFPLSSSITRSLFYSKLKHIFRTNLSNHRLTPISRTDFADFLLLLLFILNFHSVVREVFVACVLNLIMLICYYACSLLYLERLRCFT